MKVIIDRIHAAAETELHELSIILCWGQPMTYRNETLNRYFVTYWYKYIYIRCHPTIFQ